MLLLPSMTFACVRVYVCMCVYEYNISISASKILHILNGVFISIFLLLPYMECESASHSRRGYKYLHFIAFYCTLRLKVH